MKELSTDDLSMKQTYETSIKQKVEGSAKIKFQLSPDQEVKKNLIKDIDSTLPYITVLSQVRQKRHSKVVSTIALPRDDQTYCIDE